MKINIPVKKYKAVIFDMDGTMIDNTAHHVKAWQEFLKQHDIKLTNEEFRSKISGRRNNQILEILFGIPLSKEEKLQFAEEKEHLYRELFRPDIKEITGLTALIDNLHSLGIRTAISTTAPAKNREFTLRELGLTDRFEVIIGDEHVSRGKPHPEIYELTAEKLGVTPSECLAFEDSPPGVASAKAAGMTVVGILSSHTSNELQGADYAVGNFDDIKIA